MVLQAELLLNCGASADSIDVHDAIKTSDEAILGLLLGRGASVDRTVDGQTPLELGHRLAAAATSDVPVSQAAAACLVLLQAAEQRDEARK